MPKKSHGKVMLEHHWISLAFDLLREKKNVTFSEYLASEQFAPEFRPESIRQEMERHGRELKALLVRYLRNS